MIDELQCRVYHAWNWVLAHVHMVCAAFVLFWDGMGWDGMGCAGYLWVC